MQILVWHIYLKNYDYNFLKTEKSKFHNFAALMKIQLNDVIR